MATVSEGVHAFDAKYLGHDKDNVTVYAQAAEKGKGKKLMIPISFDEEKAYLKRELMVGTTITIRLKSSLAMKMGLL
jgi:hypothetical protein